MAKTRNRARKNELKTRKPVGQREAERMLLVCLRRQSAFDQARGRLTGAMFMDVGWSALAIVWEAALAMAEENGGRIPSSFDALDAEVGRLMEDNEELLTVSDNEAIVQFLDYLGETDEPTVTETRAGVKSLRRFLQDQVKEEVVRAISGQYRADMPRMLQYYYEELQEIEAMESASDGLPFAGGFQPETVTLETRPTGIEFFDRYLGHRDSGGGDAAGEVLAFCGPYGSCKTTVAAMLACESAMRDQANYEPDDPDVPLTFLFSWEDDIQSLRPRLLSYAAGIKRSNLEEGNLSTPGNLHPYERRREQQERQRLGDQSFVYPCELERAQAYASSLNQNLRVIDFAGESQDFQVQACEMASGVAAIIKHYLRKEGRTKVGRVIIDYAGAAAKFRCMRHNLDMSSELRHLIGTFPLDLKHQVAAGFDCSVWLMHQLSTEANSRAVGVRPKMTDMAEARNMLENCHYGFAVGQSSLQRLCILACLKHRRTTEKPDRVVRIDGDFSRVVDTHGKYRVIGSSIVDAIEANRLAPARTDDIEAAEAEAAFSAARRVPI